MSNEAVEGLEDALGKLSAYGWVKMNTAQRKAIAKAARLQLSRQQSAQRDSSDTAQSTGAGVEEAEAEAQKWKSYYDSLNVHSKDQAAQLDILKRDLAQANIELVRVRKESQKLIGGGADFNELIRLAEKAPACHPALLDGAFDEQGDFMAFYKAAVIYFKGIPSPPASTVKTNEGE